MPIGRISTFSIFTTTMRDVSRTQESLFNVQAQISSGLKSETFKGLNGEVEQFVQLESKISKSRMYEQNNSVNISRAETTNVALDQIIKIAQDMNNLMVLRRNPALEDDIAFDVQIRSQIRSLARELNTTFDGRYIFGGTRTNINPVVVDPDVPAPVTVGELDANYYQGAAEDSQARVDENTLISIDVRADHVGFQRLFGAAALALAAHAEPDANESDDMLVKAIDMIQEGIKDVTAVQAETNTNVLLMRNVNDRHKQLQLYWQGVTESVSKTDVLAASSKLAMDQAVLQASFQAFSTVNRLRLVDFL